MAAITSLGVGSGLDLEGMITKLMQIEQQPVLALQKKESSYQSRISAIGSLTGSLAALQTAAAALTPSSGQTAADKFTSYSASVADSNVATATAAKGAVAGSYSLEVTSLAKNQRLVSPASAFTSASTPLAASGTLTIEFGKFVQGAPSTYAPDAARQLSVSIAAGASLNDIRDAINAKNGEVSATIVTGTNGPQLVLTGAKTGTDNVMRLSGLSGADAGNFTFDPVTPAAGTLSETAAGGQAASNAAFLLNGIAATSSTNTVTGALDGVTLTLNKTNIGTPTTLTVGKDATGSLTSTLKAFVKAYNDANSTMGMLGTYNATTKIAGPLQGDSALRSAQGQVRGMLFNVTAGGSSVYQRLSDIGVSLAKDGTLSLDTVKLNKAVSADYAGVTTLVAKLGDSYNKSLENIVGSKGMLSAATDSTNRMIKDLTARGDVLAKRLTQVEASYRKQFSALDTMIAGLKQTGSYLTQQLTSLANLNTSISK